MANTLAGIHQAARSAAASHMVKQSNTSTDVQAADQHAKAGFANKLSQTASSANQQQVTKTSSSLANQDPLNDSLAALGAKNATGQSAISLSAPQLMSSLGASPQKAMTGAMENVSGQMKDAFSGLVTGLGLALISSFAMSSLTGDGQSDANATPANAKGDGTTNGQQVPSATAKTGNAMASVAQAASESADDGMLGHVSKLAAQVTGLTGDDKQEDGEQATTGKKSPGLFENGAPGFGDVLDVINPLHHIPIVNGIYTQLTGDDAGYAARVAGGFLYGGGIGALASTLDSGLESASGKSGYQWLASAVGLGDDD